MAWLAGALQAGVGLYQTYKAQNTLDTLNSQPEPNYSVSPELSNSYNRAEGLSSQGYTGSEKAAFGQNVAQQQNTGYQQGVQMSGGNLAQALSAGLQSQKLNSFNDFAASDANLHRANIHYADSLAQEMQNQKNLIDQNKIQRRQMLEQAYGGGLKTGISNIMGGGMTGVFSAFGLDKNGRSINSNGGNLSDQQYSDKVDSDINSGVFNK